MSTDELLNIIKGKFGEEAILSIDEKAHPTCFEIASQNLVSVCQELQTNNKTYFDMLSCITALDNGVDDGTMEIFYNLYSIPFDIKLMLKVTVGREKPVVPTLSKIWKTADWHEREAYDLLGIHFEGHPDLRRILLPADWEGYPLRKDYQHQEYYRGIKVEY